MGKANK